MPLQVSGQISLSNIAAEKRVTLSNVSLVNLSTASINTDPCNPVNPNNGAPHAISELYGYNHTCVTPSGPVLKEKLYAGIFRDEFDACNGDPFRQTEFIFFVEEDEFGIPVYVYEDPDGKIFPQEGYYYDFERNTPAYIEQNTVVLILCDGGFEEPRR